MTKLVSAWRKRMLDKFARPDAIHRVKGFEPTALRKQVDRAVLDVLATNVQIAEETEAYITATVQLGSPSA